MRLSRTICSPLLVLILALAGCTATPAARMTPAPARPSPVATAPGPVATAFEAPPPAGTRVRCPVANEVFTVTEPAARYEHKGKHYVLCCAGCLPPLQENPGKYLDK